MAIITNYCLHNCVLSVSLVLNRRLSITSHITSYPIRRNSQRGEESTELEGEMYGKVQHLEMQATNGILPHKCDAVAV